ncbi:DNA-primase RepB domain-containing protein [Bradyrhizobium liaoningense]|uniref:DNA-primase RepB domain-containing protein n=1 Tax=Bradyrhizobium liaoningense TaxID=43992 RepID=UPI001BABEB8D|nr:DNA-primase RepB domain-containing protein [Bradyrhizobium liaoningense]MBR0982340.1 PriCT-2 domain-containing protein [Bradyrhizobium liaoningense]
MLASPIALDIDAARLHVETLFGTPDAIVNIRTTPESEACVARVFGVSKSQTDKQRHRFKFMGRLDDLSSVLRSRNSKGWAIFITPNDTDGRGVKKENITRVRNVVLDLDGEPLPPRGFRIQPHIIVETSRGKYQCTWCTEPTTDIAAAEDVSRRLALRYNGDPKVCDASHVFRLAGFVHQKPGRSPFVTRILHVGFEPPIKLSRFDFLPLVPEQPRRASEGGAGVIDEKAAALLFKHFPVEALNSNDAWLTFAMALHAACDGDGEVARLFFDFCLSDPTYCNDYDDALNQSRWESFDSDREGGLTAGTLRKLCRDNRVPGDVIFRIFNDAAKDFENV